MSTESRIEARDAKAAGGVVAEAFERLWRIAAETRRLCLTYTVNAKGEDIRTILDALTAAQAREAGLREQLRSISWQEVRLGVGEGVLSGADVLIGANVELRRRAALSAPTPEAPTMTDGTQAPQCSFDTPYSEDNDPHDWVDSNNDDDLAGNRTSVECRRCGVPGERDDDTGSVYWPTT